MPKRVMGLPVRPRNTGSSDFLSTSNGRNVATVSGQRGQTRHLLTLPRLPGLMPTVRNKQNEIRVDNSSQ